MQLLTEILQIFKNTYMHMHAQSTIVYGNREPGWPKEFLSIPVVAKLMHYNAIFINVEVLHTFLHTPF